LIHYTFITDIVRKVINKFALLFYSALYYYFDQFKEEEMGWNLASAGQSQIPTGFGGYA
jgi:hypothetical protein